jgi:hypothetical protein
MTGRMLLLAALVLCAAPRVARAQTMLDQEQRLIEIHSLLLDLPPLLGPAALPPGTLSLSLEAVTIPEIDGTTGSKEQITASDRTQVFPRPRAMLGLPAPAGLRAFVGLSYIPPVEIRDVSTHYAAGEAGIGLAHGMLRVAARAHAMVGRSRAPVTDPDTRDELETTGWGAALAVGVRLESGALAFEPYAGGGVVSVDGRFEVTSDANVLRSTYTGAALHAGLRLVLRSRWELATEVAGYPDRLVHTNVRLGYLFRL